MTRDGRPDGLGIVAGGGGLPRVLAERCRERGDAYRVYGIEGFADAWVDDHPGLRLDLWSLDRLVEDLRDSGCGSVCLAGGVRRPSFDSRPGGRAGVERLGESFRDGDDKLLQALAGRFAEEGLLVLGAQDLVPELLAEEGRLAGPEPTSEQLADAAGARGIVAALGRLDVGQAAVVAEGRCLGVEVVDGTDAMLARVAAMDGSARGGARRGRGVLVKAPKPGQDRRLDLPAIGAETIERAARAGLGGIAVEAGGVLLIERERLAAAADVRGVGVWAFPPD